MVAKGLAEELAALSEQAFINGTGSGWASCLALVDKLSMERYIVELLDLYAESSGITTQAVMG